MIKEADSEKIIKNLVQDMKKIDKLKQPEWSMFIKTGVNTERPPTQEDWWYIRSSALLRKIYLNGPVGVERLRNAFGGKKRRGHKPPKHAKAGGKIIRVMLQQLEEAGLVKKVETPKRGRVITPKGEKLLAKTARRSK